MRLNFGLTIDEVKNELRAIDKLCRSDHPNIVQVFNMGQLKKDSVLYFIDMELCDFTLEKYIQGHEVPHLVNWTTLREKDELTPVITGITNDIVDGLIFIHGQNEVHRDLAPNNG